MRIINKLSESARRWGRRQRRRRRRWRGVAGIISVTSSCPAWGMQWGWETFGGFLTYAINMEVSWAIF